MIKIVDEIKTYLYNHFPYLGNIEHIFSDDSIVVVYIDDYTIQLCKFKTMEKYELRISSIRTSISVIIEEDKILDTIEETLNSFSDILVRKREHTIDDILNN